ncbi:PepSY domain-containing protein [Hyphobacterium sp. SN044]|uniref:PepSY domain-containing protein n=1 Tax=Hyphobacterium sp. SN044 TaxID=2912575 RepID=UPI001F3A591D|nr:PepSY domain-containing protein [Hyphobacterium sp. SN044]MCF8880387.1 PepSY domain-containing protein [Hyphobacterium sp. SN044]
MVIKRWAIRIHKWVALAVGLQIVLWVLGGVVMSAIPIERVHGDHNIAPQTAGALDLDGVLAPMEVAERAGVVPLRAELRDYLGRTVYVFSTIAGPVRVDARSGERLPPVTEEEARRVARADYAGDDEIAEVRFFPEPTWEYRREGPAWRVEFADGEHTRLYVSTESGSVTARRNDSWRVFDTFWALHIMNFGDREDFNHPLLIIASVLALISSLAGFYLLFPWIARLTGWGRSKPS